MKIPHLSGLILLVLSLSSCTGLTQKEIQEIKQPVNVSERVSDYSEALDKFSALLKAYGEPQEPLFLLGKSIVNRTACGSLPMDVTQMMATAVNRIGGNVHYISYNPTYIEIERAHLGFPAGRIVPTLVFDGAITECDENIDTREKGINSNLVGSYHGQEGETAGDYSKTINLSRLALDMHLMEYGTSMQLPRVQSSLAVDIKTALGGYQFAIQALGSGFGINSTRKITQGKHDAIRALVNLSVLQVLGKYLQVPYWRCLPDAEADREVIRILEEDFARAESSRAIGTIQINLQKFGYNVRVTGIVDASTKQAIADIAAKSNSGAPSIISPHLYSYLYLNRPISSWEPNFMVSTPTQQIVDWQEAKGQTQIQEQQAQINQETYVAESASPEPPPLAAPAPSEAKSIQPFLGLQTAVIYRPGKLGETVLISGGKLKSGDKYKVVVEPEQDCYLYLFQLDSGGRLFPLFPRSDRTDGLTNPVKGDLAYEFPGKGQYFYLDQRKGEEYIYFYSSTKPDWIIERTVEQLNQPLPDSHKQQIEKELLRYLTAKETVAASGSGKSLPLKGDTGAQSIRMNRISKLGKNKLYIFPFKHR